jgi:hypothetical protein
MNLTHRQQHQLHLIEAVLVSSDPQLAGKLGLFGQLFGGEGMPAWERVPSRQGRIRQAAALLTEAITVMAAAISLALRAARSLVIATVRRGPRPPTGAHPRMHPPRPGPGRGGGQAGGI